MPVVELLDTYQVANLLQIHPQTLRRWAHTGQFIRPLDLPVQRWAADDVQAWINSRREAQQPRIYEVTN